MPRKRNRQRHRGSALLLHAFMLMGTVGMVGLAVDVGTIYMIKARLSAAVDAASLAAGRSVNLANTVAQAQSQATAAATSSLMPISRRGFSTPLARPL